MLEGFLDRPEPVVVVGDWNQRIPRSRSQPKRIYEALKRALPEGVEVVTAGDIEAVGGRLIDHLALGPGLEAAHFAYFGPRDAEDRTLSDHVGYRCHLRIERRSG